MSQSNRTHVERLNSRTLDWLAKEVRDMARRPRPHYSPSAAELRAVVEYLLRPTAETVRLMEAHGLTDDPLPGRLAAEKGVE